MNGFEKRARHKKAAILNATLELLQTPDPRKLRISDIAGKAGVSQVTIYNYFGSKEALVREVYKDYMRKALEEFEAFVAGDHSLKEKVEYIISQKKKSSRAFTPQAMKQIWHDDPEMARFVEEEYMSKGLPLLIRLIEDGKKKGEISVALSTSTIVMYMQMWTNQADAMRDYARQQENMEAFIEEAVHLFFYGVSEI